VQALTEITLLWLLGMVGASVAVAAIALLVVGLSLGASRPAWFRVVRAARTGAAVLGAALVLVGLLHYRDTAHRGGEVHWLALGVAVLAGAGVVHWWVLRTERRVRG
ncbi:MAG TPA: hypothetical protein VFX28_17525, partial [Methylomirabilota bacterium]|nr:hypothetical protein [Methylomirabilota bacterium]